jgi:plastocyanin
MARRTCLATAATLLLVLTCAPAHAANFDVGTTGQNRFSPASVTVSVGDTVTWANQDSVHYHNVHFDDGSFEMPMDPIDGMWSVYKTFTTPGTFTYYCEAHQDVGMTGTVVVNAAPPGGGGGGGGGGPPPVADTAPVASLVSPSRQRVGKLFVRASMNEAGTLGATGTVSVPGGSAKLYRFKRARMPVAANQSVKLRLMLAKGALRAVKRALRHGKKLRAKVTVTATDMTGHKTARRQTIRLKR